VQLPERIRSCADIKNEAECDDGKRKQSKDTG
jgi:hypothetical protein